MDRQLLNQKIEENPFEPLWKIVYEFLKEEIISLSVKPGSVLNEKQISETLEISRSPVTTAINLLVEDTLVIKKPGQSAVVTEINYQNYKKIMEARIAVETKAVGLATKIITKDQLAQLRNTLIEFEKYGNENKLESSLLDDKFHKIIIKSANNIYITKMYETIQPWLLRYRYYVAHYTPENIYSKNPSFHIAIYNALKLHLSEVAVSEIIADIERMEKVILKLNIDINK
ncbi:MAG: GntR family transcriptional regulator [Christensenellaceae bacterium]|nr:GntR family transcriptional regulator [Christensenellaceae bacterium]